MCAVCLGICRIIILRWLDTVLTWAWCLKCKKEIDPWELWKLLQCGMQTYRQRKIFQSFFIDFYILIISKSTESFSFCLFEYLSLWFTILCVSWLLISIRLNEFAVCGVFWMLYVSIIPSMWVAVELSWRQMLS
jgi:hypothetical protein